MTAARTRRTFRPRRKDLHNKNLSQSLSGKKKQFFILWSSVHLPITQAHTISGGGKRRRSEEIGGEGGRGREDEGGGGKRMKRRMEWEGGRAKRRGGRICSLYEAK